MPEEHDPDPTGDRPESDDRDRDVWTGRAGVRPYGAVPRSEYDQDGDWADPNQVEPSGRWWTPIAVGSISLVLLVLLGFGVMVIVQSIGDDVDTPEATPTAGQLPGGTEAGVTTPTVTTTVSTPPTTDAADQEVNVPALRGMPLIDAQAALERTGLGWRVIRRESDAEPDTVIDCDPAEGQQVPSDTRVTLIVASARAGAPTSSAPVNTTPSNGATR